MKILVVGAGYVGLVTAACLSSAENAVVCVDTDPSKIARLRQGVIPIYEPGLKEVVDESAKAGRLQFAEGISAGLALLESLPGDVPDLIFIAVGTPQGEDGSADLRYVLAAAREIGQTMNAPAIIINKSTVPVGTADLVKGEIAWQLFQRKLFIDFDVASNPEFLKEGAALDDFFNPDRIVIGTSSDATREQLLRLYRRYVKSEAQLLTVGVKEAELIKYASNAMLATRISFMNEIANVCDRFGINVEDVRAGMGSDSRIGAAFLRPGCGYGGSCFPKDVQALVRIAQSVGVDPLVLNGVEARNKKQKQYLFEQIVARMGKDLEGRRICVWGLAFKPDTDDMREASSIDLIRALCFAGAEVRAHDPVAHDVARQIFADLIRHGKLVIEADPLVAATDADAVVLVTEWAEYKTIDFSAVKATVRDAVVFDGRNHLDHELLKKLGFHYTGIGRA
jgi:UDPglucose 6-dehydrogenase